MAKLPGGHIIGGQGGRIYFGELGSIPATFDNLTLYSSGTQYLDITGWQISREWINAECTHSGTWGAITRRWVASDWHFSATMPVQQDNMADRRFGFLAEIDSVTTINCSMAFYLGNVTANPEAVAMQMPQKFYYAPAAIIRAAMPVLDASRDVIRMQLSGEGNSRLFLIPDEMAACQPYLTYLSARGWTA